MAIHFVDTDEAVSAIGEASLTWRKRPCGNTHFSASCENDSQETFRLMLEVLGRSKRPQAARYLVRLLENETRSNVQSAILVELHRHQQKDEVRQAIIAGIERGDAAYFSSAPHLPEIRAIVAKKLLESHLKTDAFSAAVSYLTYDDGKPAEDALRQAYTKKLHADDPDLWIDVLSGLAHHGDRQRLPEAFDLLVKVIAEPLPSSADKKQEYERKSRIDHLVRSLGSDRNFPTTLLAEFLHGKDADKQPAVREAVKTLLEESPGLSRAYKTLPALPAGVVRLARGDDAAKGTT